MICCSARAACSTFWVSSTPAPRENAWMTAHCPAPAIEAPLSDVHPQRQGTEVTDTAVDRASGVEICHTMLIRRTGQAWAMPAADKKDAEINASAIHDFLAGQT